MFDPILVNVPGGQRPRGSFNRAARLAKRVVEIDPTRHAMFGLLASIFASAGVPGSAPTLGVTRSPSSFPDLIQVFQQRENLRIYVSLLGDTLLLVPAESLATIPKDSVRAMRKRARAVGRSWADRWVSASQGIAAPYALMSELHALDGEYPAALKALAKAESLGVQNPAWSAPARRLTYLGKQGALVPASRLADSLTAAGFFGKPANLLSTTESGAWAFALHLAAGKFQNAGELYRQSVALRKMLNPGSQTAELVAFLTLMGNTDPEDEPGIPRAFRAMQLDTLLARIVDLAAADPIGGWAPGMLPMLADAINPVKPRLTGVLEAADAVASSGRASFAFQLASNAVDADSTLEAEAALFPWYRAGAEALTATRRATQARFRPASATISADRAVFEWSVSDSAPFPRHRPETPVSTGEYRWQVIIDADNRRYQMTASDVGRTPVSTPTTGSLADILTPTARRSVSTGKLSPTGVQQDTTMLQGVALRTEIAPGVLRMVVTDRAILDLLGRSRPAQARFRFRPCARPPGSGGKTECVDEMVGISYPR